jgi:hypothetical protein
MLSNKEVRVILTRRSDESNQASRPSYGYGAARAHLRAIVTIAFLLVSITLSLAARSEACGVCKDSYLSCVSRSGNLDSCAKQMRSCESACFGTSRTESQTRPDSGNHPGDNPFLVGISFGLIFALAVYGIAESSTTTVLSKYRAIKWITGIVLSAVGLLVVAAISQSKSFDDIGGFTLWAYLFFSIPHLAIIAWVRKHAVIAGLNQKIKSDSDIPKAFPRARRYPSAYKQLVDAGRNGKADQFIKELALSGLEELHKIINSIDPTLPKEKKTKIALQKFATVSGDANLGAQTPSPSFPFGYLFGNCKGFEYEAMKQGVYFGLFKTSLESYPPLRPYLYHYLRIGYGLRLCQDASGKYSNRSPGGWEDAKAFIDKEFKFQKNSEAAFDYLKQSLKVAEDSLEQFSSKFPVESIAKACEKFSHQSITPIYSSLTKHNSRSEDCAGTVLQLLDKNPSEYPGLSKFSNSIKIEIDRETESLKSAALTGKASPTQLRELSEVVTSKTEKFTWLARALVGSALTENFTERAELKHLTPQAIKKLRESWEAARAEGATLRPSDFADCSTYEELEAFLKSKIALKKTLDQGWRDGIFTHETHYKILSSRNNFPCPMCAEIIGEKIRKCPYCEHRLD